MSQDNQDMLKKDEKPKTTKGKMMTALIFQNPSHGKNMDDYYISQGYKRIQGDGEPVWVQILVLLFFCVLCAGGGGVCGVITAKEFGDDSPWYSNLTKPSWNPPSALFGPVWTILYLLMAVAAWFIWRETGFCRQPLPLIVFFVQLAFNFAWTFIFGLAHELLGAFIEIVLLWLLIVLTMILFYRVKWWVPLLLVPYLAWVTFASCLNFALYKLNPDNGELNDA